MLMAVIAAHTVEGNWQVRIKRGFGCWGDFPMQSWSLSRDGDWHPELYKKEKNIYKVLR